MNKTRLSEWLLTGSLLAILFSLLLLAKIQSSLLEAPAQKAAPMVELAILGAVKKPGVYSLEAGSSVKEFLRKAAPSRFADLRGLDLQERVWEGRELVVRELEEICVEVSGAVVESKMLTLPVGSRVCQLKKWLELSPGADKAAFKSRRLLRDGEKIFVCSEVDKKKIEDVSYSAKSKKR